MPKRIIPIVTLLAIGAGATAYAAATARADCPGRIVCPLNGELVCKDRCPLGERAKAEANELPACCRERK